MKKRATALLTLSILASLAVPSYAAEPANTDEAVRTPDVVVTATRTEEEVKAVPNTVEVITQEDIQKLGATDVYSALRLANNVDVTSAGMAGHNVMIRGMSTNHTLILIDGKRFAGEDTSVTQNVYALDRMSLSNIERIEIVRGSASAQYGSDAMGGVINIITKKSEKPSTTVGISTGTDSVNNYYHFDFGKNGNFSSTFDMRFSDLRKNMDAGDEGSNYYGPVQDFNFGGTWDLSNNKYLDLNLGYYNEHTKADYADEYVDKVSIGNRTMNFNKWTSKDKKEWYDYRRYDASIGFRGKTDRSDYLIRTYYSRLDKENRLYNNRDDFSDIIMPKFDENGKPIMQTLPNGMQMPVFTTAEESLGGLYPKYDWDKSTYTLWGLEGKNTVQTSDKHLITYGGEYRQNSVEGTRMGDGGDNAHKVTQNGVTKDYSEKDINSWAGYIQDEWMPNEKWLIIPSVRYDHDSAFGGKATPKIGATYFIKDNSRIKANWGKGFKAPTISELYMTMNRAMGPMTVHVLGNPDLDPEESTYWDLSYEAELNNNWGKITYFNNDVKNLIDSAKIPGMSGYWYRYVNIDKASIDGVELELGRKLNDNWTVKLTSNWLDAKNETTDEWLDDRAENMSTLQLIYDDNDPYGISATLWNQWATNYHYSETIGMGDNAVTNYYDTNFSTLNFVINKKFGEGNRVYAGVDNIFNEKDDNINLDGRIWRAGAEWTF